MANLYSTERYRLKAAQEKEMRALLASYTLSRQQLEAKHKAALQALRAAHTSAAGARPLGRPIRPRPEPEVVRGLWAQGYTAAEMATALRCQSRTIYEVLATLPEYHRAWAMLREGKWMSEIAAELALPMVAIQAVKLSVRKKGA